MALTAEDRNAWKAVQEESQSSMQTNIVSVHHLDNLLFKHFAALKVDEISRRSRDFDVDGKSDQSIPDGRSDAVADSIDCDVQRLCEITQLLSKENEHLQSQFHEMDYALQVSKSEKQSLQEELNTSKNTIESLQEVEVKMQLAIQSLHNCEQTIATLQQEKAELHESVVKLETELHNVCDHVCHMDEQNKDLISQIEMLAGKVLILENYVCKFRENVENENSATTGPQDDIEESAIDHQHDTETCKSLALVQEANSIQPTMALPEQNENTMENEEEDAKLDLGELTVCLLDGLAKVEEELEKWKENSRGLEFALVTAKAQRTSNLLVRYAVPAATTAFLAGLIVINAKSSKHPS